MRVITISILTLGTTLVTSSLAPVLAHAKAKPKAAPAAEAPTESAAARAARQALAEDTGALRDSNLRAEVVHVDIATANATERAPTLAAEAQLSTAPLSGALEELVAKQVSRNEAAFDRCVADARTRNPELTGTVELVVNVAGRRATARVATGPADPAFSTCVAQAARTLKLSLPDLAFPWRLTLGKATAAGGSARAALP
jgi:hypothetical protein